MPKLVCSRCELELKCIAKNVGVIQYNKHGPYSLAFADEWGCACDFKVLVVGGGIIASPHQADFIETLKSFPRLLSMMYLNYGDTRTKYIHRKATSEGGSSGG